MEFVSSIEVGSALVAGVVLAVAFVGWELRATKPMLPMRLFRSRAFSAASTAIFFWWASGLGTVFFMAQFLQNGLGYGPLGAGLQAYICGPTLLVEAAADGLVRIGVPPERVRTERFGPTGGA